MHELSGIAPVRTMVRADRVRSCFKFRQFGPLYALLPAIECESGAANPRTAPAVGRAPSAPSVRAAISLMCESLLRQAPDGSMEPGLTTVANPNPTTVVFTLRPGGEVLGQPPGDLR